MKENRANRYSFINLVFWLFLIISAITRGVLLVKSIDIIERSFTEIAKIFLIGAFYDFVSAGYLVIPFVLYLFFMPQKFFAHGIHRYITYAFTYILLFGAVFFSI